MKEGERDGRVDKAMSITLMVAGQEESNLWAARSN
jgi:hypothetical protein